MNADDMIGYGHQFLMNALERINPKDADIKTACGVWSVKDLVIHLTVSEYVFLDAMHYIQGETDLPYLTRAGEEGEAFNDTTVAEAQHKSYDEVLADYHKAHEASVACLKTIDVETRRKVGILPWYGAEYDLEDYFVYSIYAHKREHSAHITTFADNLG